VSPRIPIVDVPAEYAEIGAEIEAAVLRVLRSGRYVLGPETQAFERELAAFLCVRHAVGVGSGTEALWLSLRACGVGPGDEVITSSLSFFATAEAILWTGATPVYVDVERGGFHLDPAGLEAARSPRTRAVVPVHLFGRCADMARIREFADCYGLPVVEDAAQAIGAARGGARAGTSGRAGCLSFYPSKPLAAAGDAGAVVTDDDELADAIRSLRHHGAGPGGHERVGTTSRLDSIQAAVLRAKLPHLSRWLAQRAERVAYYRARLRGVANVWLPEARADEEPAWSQLVIRSEKADAIRRALDEAEIEWRHHYPRPLYREPAFGAGRLAAGTCPEAERACAESISLPLYAQLAPAAIDRVCRVIREAVGA
jgi:dTDP-4-amino-4,6-dideoxygalactose transaminase